MSKEVEYIPSYPLVRPRSCPSGPPRHPVNRENPDQCGLSRLMRDFGASEGLGGLISDWTRRSFTRVELEQYGFTVGEKPKQVPQAKCRKCGLEMDLRRTASRAGD